MRRTQQSRRDKPEQHQIDMNGTNAPKLQITDIGHKIRGHQIAGRQQAHQR